MFFIPLKISASEQVLIFLGVAEFAIYCFLHVIYNDGSHPQWYDRGLSMFDQIPSNEVHYSDIIFSSFLLTLPQMNASKPMVYGQKMSTFYFLQPYGNETVVQSYLRLQILRSE